MKPILISPEGVLLNVERPAPRHQEQGVEQVNMNDLAKAAAESARLQSTITPKHSGNTQ